MNYNQYLDAQISIHSPIKKPRHYHIAEAAAIDRLFQDVPRDRAVLDVGCGTGRGMRHLRRIGFKDVSGIELHPMKAAVAEAFVGDAGIFRFPRTYDLIYSSHSFEHVYRPDETLQHLLLYAPEFIFILPYPDFDPAFAHCASAELGLNREDDGRSVIAWFEGQGLGLIRAVRDSFREPEIWLHLAA